MVFRIKEGNENNVLSYNIDVEDFDYITYEKYDYIITKMIKESQLLKIIKFPEYIINLVKEIIIGNRDIEYLKMELSKSGVPLYSLIMNLVNVYKTKYQRLLEISSANEIEIECTKDNLIKGLELAKKLNKKILIDGKSISFSDYYQILSDYDIDSLAFYDIKIDYQEQNTEITIKELYDTSIIINNISEEIKKYNLSSFEKIIYVYDKVKSKVYKKSDDDEHISRDLDKILKGNFIVCVGFSNLFNAVLRNLGINAIPLVSIEKWHQCSLVYIQDEKYGIDGVYVFDPTNDSKSNEEYINNYDYFGMTLSNVMDIHPNDIYKLTTMSFDDLLKLSSENLYDYMNNVDKINMLENLFRFVKIFNYKEFLETIIKYKFISKEERENTIKIYQNFINKYNPKEIGTDKFLLALCNTRIIEYYNGIVNDFDIEEIRDAIGICSNHKKFNCSKCDDTVKRIIEAFDFELDVYNVIDDILCERKEDIERKGLNVRLLKVLRNKQK